MSELLQTKMRDRVLYVVRHELNKSGRAQRVLYEASKDKEYKKAQAKVLEAANIFTSATSER